MLAAFSGQLFSTDVIFHAIAEVRNLKLLSHMKKLSSMKSLIILVIACLSLFSFINGCGKSDKKISTFDDVSNAKIGVMTGTTGESIAEKRFPDAEVKSFDDIMDAVAAIKSGQIDAIITAYPTALQVSKTNSELWRLPEPLSNEDTSIAVKKGNEALLGDVNRIITQLKSDGTLASMKSRWFKEDLSPYEEIRIPSPNSGEVLKIGVCATREPFSFVDKDGRVTGHDGELARIISAKLQRPVEFSNMKFMALIPALQSGKVDLIVSGMTATEERRKLIDFSEPYFANSQVMLVRKAAFAQAEFSQPKAAIKGNNKLSSIADLQDKRIGLLLGSVHDSYAAEKFPKATLLQYKTPSDILLAVKSGKADAGIYTRETLVEILRNEPELGLLGESLFSIPIAMGFNKDNSSLREKFNEFLRQIVDNGVYNDMVERWMRQGDTRMPKISNSKSNGSLIVGNVSDKGLPFTVLKENKLIGFDIELAERFGAFLGREVVFSDMEFGNLIAAVSTKKIDMIASTLMVTDERKKQISFSEKYYELGTNVFALKQNIANVDNAPQAKISKINPFMSIVDSFRSNIVEENRYLLILDGLQTTVIISVLASIFGTLLGALICFMRMSRIAVLNLSAKTYISILRGTPVLVLLMLIFYVVFASVDISPVIVAVIAFGMNFAAYSAEIFRAGIEGIDKGQTEAGISLGFTRIKTFFNIILPQTVRRILPVFKGEFISLIKMTSIVGYIAVQDLTKASDIIRSRTFDAFFPLVMIAILYFLISWILTQSLEYLERKTDPKAKRRKLVKV